MMKINDIKIIYGAVYALLLLAILVVGVMVVPGKANAGYGNVIPYESPSFSNNNQNYYQETIYVEPKVVYVQPKIVYVEPKVVHTSSNTATAPQTTTQEVPTEEEVSDEEVVSDLAANAVYGSNSFLPSGLIQWVLFAIIILIIIILVRKISGADKKYHQAPLKHA